MSVVFTQKETAQKTSVIECSENVIKKREFLKTVQLLFYQYHIDICRGKCDIFNELSPCVHIAQRPQIRKVQLVECMTK